MQDYKAKTKESYNKHAAFHAQRFTGLTNLLRRSEFKCFVDLLPGRRVLDLGCGGGERSLVFQQAGLEVAAIDISEGMVALARAKGITAEVMDIENLIFAPETFDGVWAVTSLLHIPKARWPGVIKKLYEILKPGGILYICVKEGDGENMVQDNVDGSTERFFSFWKKDELLSYVTPLFTQISFTEERVELDGRVFVQLFFRK